MIAPHLLSVLLLLAPAKQPPPDDDPEAVLDEAAEAPADDAALDQAAAEDAAVDPLLAGVFAKLSPQDAEAIAALDEAGMQALVEKIEQGAPLSGSEQAFADALQATMIEQFDAQLTYQTGDVELSNGLAVLHLGDGFRYLDPQGAKTVLEEAWGNPPGPPSLGMIVPADISPLDPEHGWGVVITYAADGFVEDDDADDIDYDELLEQMKEATEADNPGRTAQGYAPMHLVGWAEPPRYDEAGHRLYWAKELSTDDSPIHSLNYAIRVLGRRGVLELNAVATMQQLPAIKPEMEKVLSQVEFLQGNRYEDFDPDIDSVAAYGIGGLVAGKVLAKTGLLAGLLKMLVAAKKLLVVAAIGIAIAIKKLLGRKSA